MNDVASIALNDRITLSYRERGSGDNAIVMLPGPTDSWRSYEPILDRMPDDLRAVAVSLRGHGDSSKPETGFGVEDLATDVVPLLDGLDIDRAVLVGHSGSGLVARRIAIDHPDRVAGLILEASPLTLRGDENLLNFVETTVAELADPISADFAHSFIADTSATGLDPALVDRLVDEVTKVPRRVWHQMFGSLCTYDDTSDLSQITAPTLLVWGDHDELVPRSMQDELLEATSTIRLTVYSGSGHTPRWEQPRQFAADVAAFAGPLIAPSGTHRRPT